MFLVKAMGTRCAMPLRVGKHGSFHWKIITDTAKNTTLSR